MKAVFLRVIEAPVDEKAQVLQAAARGDVAAGTRFDVELDGLRQLPQSPFAYWVADGISALFGIAPPYEARRGLGTDDDFRFIRLSFETSCQMHEQRTWIPLAKGGAYAPFSGSLDLCLMWSGNGRELRALVTQRWGNEGKRIYNESYYFRPGLTWSPRTTKGLSLRILPADCIIASKGPALFLADDSHQMLLALLGVGNSCVFKYLVGLQLAAADAAARSYEVGVLQRTPVPNLSAEDVAMLSGLSRRAWALTRVLGTRTETSHALVLPALFQVAGDTLQSRAQAWANLSASRQQEIAAIQAEIDDQCFALYGIGLENRLAIEAGFGSTEGSDEPADDDDDPTDDEVDAAPLVASLLSWSLGVAFGRFDVRLATGARPLPLEPDPFDPLPICSPGMLTGDDGLPVDAPPSGYPLRFPTDGILVDDPGHPRDLLKAVRAVFDEVLDDANARWHEAAELVDARGGELRDWFARSFSGEHIKRYSKSRRKAPIYWQLATSSGSYSVWVYIHRATPDTLFRVLNDFVGPKLDHEREKLDRMTRDAGPNPSRTDRDALAAQEAFVAELQALRAEVARVAPLWKPDLDDGVILNFAPLWRLVPQERSWQNECRKAWDKLCAHEYDWAHLAMHLWPEEVVPKCAKDRSLAIAHGLEEALWSEDDAGNWHPANVPDATLRTLIADRTSTSVKAALKDLLSAPAPAGKAKGRRGRSTPQRTPTTRRTSPSSSAPTPSSTASMDEATLTAVRAAIAAVADGASKADVLAATSLSDGDWNRAIAALLDRGDVTRTGQKRGTRYHAVRGGDR